VAEDPPETPSEGEGAGSGAGSNTGSGAGAGAEAAFPLVCAIGAAGAAGETGAGTAGSGTAGPEVAAELEGTKTSEADTGSPPPNIPARASVLAAMAVVAVPRTPTTVRTVITGDFMSLRYEGVTSETSFLHQRNVKCCPGPLAEPVTVEK
jgi:hypothetical protein